MPRAGVNKEKIFILAEKLSDEKGYENISMALLATELGIKTPSLYKHVKNLEEIQEYLAEKGLFLLRMKLEPSCRGNGNSALSGMAKEYRNFAIERPGLYAAFQKTHVNRSPKVQKEAKLLLDLIFSVLVLLPVKKKDLIPAARALRSALHGFIALELAGGFGMPIDIEDSFDFMIKSFIRGVSGFLKIT